MRSITPKLTPELKTHNNSVPPWRARPYPISTFRELVEHTARLAFANPDELLFFRGQDRDYQNKAGGSTLYPALYRNDSLSHQELTHRFALLEYASRRLADRFISLGMEGHRDVARKRFIQWSILQHYGVIDTPLLDVTQSLRVACSFAQLAATESECVVFVLGLPYLTNRISINSEHELVNVRLLSICPPAALRPYFQEGFLAGTTDITADYDDKTELDFRNRLIAKFAIPRVRQFWGNGFSVVPKSALYPPGDEIKDLCDELRAELQSELIPGDLGSFIREWAALEARLVDEARRISERNVSVREAIRVLATSGRIAREQQLHLDTLRRLRNSAVHKPETVAGADLAWATRAVRDLNQIWKPNAG